MGKNVRKPQGGIFLDSHCIIPSTRFVVSYHLSAVHHTSPVPEYMGYLPKTVVLARAVIFRPTMYCTKTF